MAKDDEILRELKKLNETIGAIATELAFLHHWLREQANMTVRLSADDARALSRLHRY